MRKVAKQWKYDDRKGWVHIMMWCYDQLGMEGDDWYFWEDVFYFYDKKSYTMFALRWL